MNHQYRIIKQIHESGAESFRIERTGIFCIEERYYVTERDTIEEARSLIKSLKGYKIIKEEVVE